uniref:Diphthamide biosynthesis protein 3 n=2 Tax=Phasianinae TaxID=9072 RepID=A0A8C9F8X3_PAVCR
MTSTAAASSFLSPTRASEGRDRLLANPRCTGEQTAAECNEGEAGTLNGAAQSPFYKPGESYSPPTPHTSSSRSAFPPTQTEGAHGARGQRGHPVPSAARERRWASVRGRSALHPPAAHSPPPHTATPTGTTSRDGRSLCHTAGGTRARSLSMRLPAPSGVVPAFSGVSLLCGGVMAVFHDEVEIEDFEYDEETETYSYPCPCGDRFLITREDLENGEDVATCPSCSLILRVIYDQEQFMRDEVIAEPLANKELVKC